MNLSIRKWRIEDKSDLAINLNNLKVLNNLRDGLPYPYTEDDAEDFIRMMLSADPDSTFAFAITLDDTFDKNLYMNDGKESFLFRDHLIDLLNKKNIDNIVAYKSSNIDRKAFAKILSGDTKNPQKRTVLAFCVG